MQPGYQVKIMPLDQKYETWYCYNYPETNTVWWMSAFAGKERLIVIAHIKSWK